MNKIFFDTAITGHHTEYMSHLVEYLKEHPTSEVNIFVVPETLKSKFPELVDSIKDSKNIRWEFIPLEVTEEIYRMSFTKRAFAEYNYAAKIAEKFSAHHVMFLYFNMVQFALIFKRPSFSVSGILFLQFYRMTRNSIKDHIKYWRKYLVTKLFSRNKAIKNVFILNDDKTVDFLNKEFRTGIFKVLPDPIPDLIPDPNFNTFENYNIPRDKKILLHTGALDGRKGTLEILEAVKYLKPEDREAYALVIAGRASNDFDKEIKDKIAEIGNCDFIVRYENAFLPNGKLAALFRDCSVVMMPYKNPEASSGILGHACKFNKPVIGPSSGLLGEIIKNNELGITLDKCSGQEIYKAINSNTKLQHFKALEFLKIHTDVLFSKVILKKIL